MEVILAMVLGHAGNFLPIGGGDASFPAIAAVAVRRRRREQQPPEGSLFPAQVRHAPVARQHRLAAYGADALGAEDVVRTSTVYAPPDDDRRRRIDYDAAVARSRRRPCSGPVSPGIEGASPVEHEVLSDEQASVVATIAIIGGTRVADAPPPAAAAIVVLLDAGPPRRSADMAEFLEVLVYPTLQVIYALIRWYHFANVGGCLLASYPPRAVHQNALVFKYIRRRRRRRRRR
jgi:hypothetical protein